MLQFPRATVAVAATLLLLSIAPLRAAETQTLASKDGRWHIAVPGYFHSRTPGKSTIKIEAVCDSPHATLLVLADPQASFASLAEYAEKAADAVTAHLRDGQCDGGSKCEAGPYPAIRYEITGISSNGTRMAFVLTVVQTETSFAQVVGSTQRGDLARFRGDFSAAAQSLRQTPAKSP